MEGIFLLFIAFLYDEMDIIILSYGTYLSIHLPW